MTRPRILIAGIGNIFLGDDAFGIEVARKLSQRQLPDEVKIVDFGIRGLDLAYMLLDGYETVILVDTVSRGGTPGTLYVLEPEIGEAAENSAGGVEGHNLDPMKVLRLAASMGGEVGHVMLVGCEPELPADAEDMRTELSDPVRAAVGEAVQLIESLVAKLLSEPERQRGKGTLAGARARTENR
jgi:hydrogenase maturation protease